MKMKRLLKFTTAAALGVAAMHASAAPPMVSDKGEAASTAVIGQMTMKRFESADERGVKLHNTGTETITVQDIVRMTTLTLTPGTQIGLKCDSVRHLALSVDDAVTYESVACGNRLEFSNTDGGAR